MKFVRFKILLIFLIAFLVGAAFYYLKWSAQESILFSWLTFGGLYLLESIITMIRIPSKSIRLRAKEEDGCLDAVHCFGNDLFHRFGSYYFLE